VPFGSLPSTRVKLEMAYAPLRQPLADAIFPLQPVRVHPAAAADAAGDMVPTTLAQISAASAAVRSFLTCASPWLLRLLPQATGSTDVHECAILTEIESVSILRVGQRSVATPLPFSCDTGSTM
jgi:hypothetical protein